VELGKRLSGFIWIRAKERDEICSRGSEGGSDGLDRR
jgi:hypothetical protein